ncbi:MAG: glycosyltransferase, partial [Bacteroidota bacterium]
MKKLLILGYVWPEPKSSAAGARMMQLIQLFLSADFEIVYATPAQKTDFSENVNSLGIQEISIQINDSSVDQVLQEIDPTHVLFDRFMMEEQLGWRITENCPNAVKILDTEDLHFLRKARQKAHQENKPFTKSGLFTDQAKREIASILRCDLSLIISEAEMQMLLNNFDIKPQQVFYLPFLLEEEQINRQVQRKKFSERKDFVSIGNFLHPPNWDQVLYLKTEIWPLIRKELP